MVQVSDRSRGEAQLAAVHYIDAADDDRLDRVGDVAAGHAVGHRGGRLAGSQTGFCSWDRVSLVVPPEAVVRGHRVDLIERNRTSVAGSGD